MDSTDKRFARAASRRVLPLLAGAVAAFALAAGSASAQTGGSSTPTETTPPPTTPPPATYPAGTALFPVPGAHNFGAGPGARFGAGRKGHSHQGQDIFAACGEPVVAVGYNRVIARGFHPAAGNYVVLRYKRYKQDYMYAHLVARALVPKKAKVTPGQVIGNVGQTGNARGCHLHFELWVGKWYRGGHPVDPLPSLTAWDAYS